MSTHPSAQPVQLSPAELELVSSLHLLTEPALITRANLDEPGPTIIGITASLASLTGYTSEELIGRNPRLLQGPLTDRAVLARLRHACAQATRFLGESVNYRKDGSTYIVQWTVEPIRDEHGATTHFFALQRNVTRDRPFASEWLEADRRATQALEHASAQAAVIAQAILVLEQTKRSFRSKELGALREKLAEAIRPVQQRRTAGNLSGADGENSISR